MKFQQPLRLSVPGGTAAQEEWLRSADVCGLLEVGRTNVNGHTSACEVDESTRAPPLVGESADTDSVSSMPSTLLPRATVGKKLTMSVGNPSQMCKSAPQGHCSWTPSSGTGVA